jgi:hypothetical protein
MDPHSNTISSDLKKAGYSEEDAYFYRINRERIDQKRLERHLKLAEIEKSNPNKRTFFSALGKLIKKTLFKSDPKWEP